MGEMTAVRDAYGAALKELGEQDLRIVGLEADVASSTKSGIFGNAFPERYFNVGISSLSNNCRKSVLKSAHHCLWPFS